MPSHGVQATILALLLAGLAAHAAGQSRTDAATLAVRILDDSTGKPLPGAHVQVGDRLGAYTDSAGRARVTGIPPGSLVVSFGRLGYGTERIVVQFEASANVQTDVRLTPEAVPLAPVAVAVPGRDPVLAGLGFYQRQSLELGTFIAGERLEAVARGSNRLTDALLDVPGIRVARNGIPQRYGYVIASSRGAVSLQLKCFPPVYIDGVKRDYITGSIDPDVNTLVPLGDVLGIEVYPDATLSPIAYERSPCGLVLIWTKQRGAHS